MKKHEFSAMDDVTKLLKSRVRKAIAADNSKLRPDTATARAAKKLPIDWPQRAAAQRGIISRAEIADLLRENKAMKKTNLQALKPALRELAARSEQLKEFAMVRDANGRYVEVEEDGGMGAGAAIKAGAGAAALGGAGYGAYKGHQAIMGAGSNAYAKNAAFTATAADRVGGVSAVPRAQSNANFKLAKAKAAGDFERMGFMDKVKTGYGMAGKSAMNSATSKPGLLGKLGRFALKLR